MILALALAWQGFGLTPRPPSPDTALHLAAIERLYRNPKPQTVLTAELYLGPRFPWDSFDTWVKGTQIAFFNRSNYRIQSAKFRLDSLVSEFKVVWMEDNRCRELVYHEGQAPVVSGSARLGGRGNFDEPQPMLHQLLVNPEPPDLGRWEAKTPFDSAQAVLAASNWRSDERRSVFLSSKHSAQPYGTVLGELRSNLLTDFDVHTRIEHSYLKPPASVMEVRYTPPAEARIGTPPYDYSLPARLKAEYRNAKPHTVLTTIDYENRPRRDQQPIRCEIETHFFDRKNYKVTARYSSSEESGPYGWTLWCEEGRQRLMIQVDAEGNVQVRNAPFQPENRLHNFDFQGGLPVMLCLLLGYEEAVSDFWSTGRDLPAKLNSLGGSLGFATTTQELDVNASGRIVAETEVRGRMTRAPQSTTLKIRHSISGRVPTLADTRVGLPKRVDG